MYKLINAVTIETTSESGTVATPMVGYVLQDLDCDNIICVARKQAYEIGKNIGIENAKPMTRSVSCPEDKPTEEGLVYYLKLTDETKKINDLLISHQDVPEHVVKTQWYRTDLLSKYGIN